jgi:hypothetical protein
MAALGADAGASHRSPEKMGHIALGPLVRVHGGMFSQCFREYADGISQVVVRRWIEGSGGRVVEVFQDSSWRGEGSGSLSAMLVYARATTALPVCF